MTLQIFTVLAALLHLGSPWGPPRLADAPYPKAGVPNVRFEKGTDFIPLTVTDIDVRNAIPPEYPLHVVDPDISSHDGGNDPFIDVHLDDHFNRPFRYRQFQNENGDGVKLYYGLPAVDIIRPFNPYFRRPSSSYSLPVYNNNDDIAEFFDIQTSTPEIQPTNRRYLFDSEEPITQPQPISKFVTQSQPVSKFFSPAQPIPKFNIPPTYLNLDPYSYTGYNEENSEVVEPTYIVSEKLSKSLLPSLPPASPVKTFGLTINTNQQVRKEIRKDNGEFISSIRKADGSSSADLGTLIPSDDGKDQVLARRGTYSFSTPEGSKYRVDYRADNTGYHARQYPVSS